ncbi:hypothetical protein E3N88_12591 [Mikania micrantha]|uniref:CCHC-type domain-containing protein n=1 Tax=Mikania micrantha TaxID=192012 RepID=A0A5N6P7S9_9ASTR|nr:hypothetical protein E3N88_12591 [Mikania micrantha]
MAENAGGGNNQVIIHRESEPSSLVCPKLTATNYCTWVILMEAVLDAKGLWETVDPVTKDNEDPKKIKYARALIYQSLPENIIAQVARTRSAREIWEALRVVERTTMIIPEEAGVEAEETAEVGVELATTMIQGMRIKSGKAIKAEVGISPDVRFEDLFLRLWNPNQARRLLELNHGRKSLIRDTNGWRNPGGDPPLECNCMSGNPGGYPIDYVRCYNCNAYGHFAWECTKPQQPQEANINQAHDKRNTQGPALVMASVEEEKVLLFEDKVHPKVYANDPHDSLVWYLDNGASNHMTGVEKHFTELDTKVSGLVRFGDGSQVKIKGRGFIIFQCKNREQRIMDNVYYIPELCSNILSLGQMTEIGYKVWMDDDKLWLYEEDYRLLMMVHRSDNRLYKITLNIGTPVCLLATISDQAWLWHARLGHLNFRSMNELRTKNLVHGNLPNMRGEQVCDACITKEEALANFKRFKQEVEVEYSLQVKALKSDRGGEFLNHLFTSYCEETGIKRLFTTPYSPQQNGIVERRNQTGEAVRHSVYVLNRVTTKAVKNVTPYEVLKGRKPNISHLKVFGCLAHMKIPSVKTRKLDDRSKQVVHLGIESGTKGYRMFDPSERKIIISRDVEFEENKTINWKEFENHGPSATVLEEFRIALTDYYN